MTLNNVSRVNRSKQEARENYNRLSRWYDIIAGSTEEKYRRLGMALLDVQPGESVLEVGFGTGHCLIRFAEDVGPDGAVFGIDLSDEMAAIAYERAVGWGVDNLVHLLLGDGTHPPFCSKKFDSIFMSFTLELFDTPEIPDVLAHCRSILSPNGRMVIVTMAKSENPGIPERIYEWFHSKMPVAVDCRPITAQIFLHEAGFTVNQVLQEMMWGLPVEIILAKPTS